MMILLLCICLFFSNISIGLKENYKENEMSFAFSFDQCRISINNESGELFDTILLDSLPHINTFGKPVLPVKPVQIVIPQGYSLKTISIHSEERELVGKAPHLKHGSVLFPVHSNIQKNQTDASEKHQQPPFPNHQSDVSLYKLIGIYTWRGVNILHINLYPVEFHQDTKEVFFHPTLTMTVDLIQNTRHSSQPCSKEVFPFIADRVENPEMLSSYQQSTMKTSKSYEYVIITSQTFADATVDHCFSDLIQSKIEKDMPATIVTIEEIVNNPDYMVNGKWGDNNPDNPFFQEDVSDSLSLFNDTQARIRNFIRHAYSELGTSYVLLAGDADKIVVEDNILPCRKLFADEEGLPLPGLNDYYEADDIPSDVYYACLDGNFNDDHDAHFGEGKKFNNETDNDEADLYAEVWVGRVCVDSITEMQNFVKKTLWYDTTNDAYLNDLLFLGEHLGFPGVSEYGGNYKDYIEDQVLIPSTFTISKIYDRETEWNPSFLIDHLSNKSYHFINHVGHGNEDYIFKTIGSRIRSITNEKPFFLYSHSCLTGSFDNYDCYQGYVEKDCIAELLTGGMQTGAFACILNARYGLGSNDSLQSPSGAYDESFFRQVFEHQILELGRANHFAKEDHIWQIDENGMRWCFYQTNLFGDPSLTINVFNGAPSTPVIDGTHVGSIGENQKFICSFHDPDEHDIYYRVDWGDGPVTDWMGPVESDREILLNHTWENQGFFQLRIQAMDEYGKESDWGMLRIIIPKQKLKEIQNDHASFIPDLFYQLINRWLDMKG